MENRKTGFFEETPDNQSSNRLQSFIIVMVGLAIAGYQVVTSDAHTFDLPAVLSLLALGLGAKAVAKGQELKNKAT